MLDGDLLTKYRSSDITPIATTSLTRTTRKLDLDLSNNSDRDRLKALFRIANATLTIASEAKGKVRFDAGRPSVEWLNQQLMKSISDYRIEGGKITFRQKLSDSAWAVLFGVNAVAQSDIESTLTESGGTVFAIAGDWIYRVRAADLAIESYQLIHPPKGNAIASVTATSGH